MLHILHPTQITKVSTSKPLQKDTVIGGAVPLLVHQTLASRQQVLACASCWRFVGTAATQLAMLEGYSASTPPLRTATTNAALVAATTNKRRGRSEDTAGSTASGGTTSVVATGRSSALAAGTTALFSRRVAIARAPPSRLPDLPAEAEEEVAGQESKEKTEGAAAAEDPGRRQQQHEVEEDEEEEEGIGGVWMCKGGAPCDDVYCSAGCREAAQIAGHGLICFGGSEPGRYLTR